MCFHGILEHNWELRFWSGLTFSDSSYFPSKCSAAEHKQWQLVWGPAERNAVNIFELRSANGQPLWNAKLASSHDRSVYQHSAHPPQQICSVFISIYFIFSPQGIIYLFLLFQSQFRPEGSDQQALFSTKNWRRFPTFLGHSSFISVKVAEDLHELHKYAKPPFLTLETTLLCSRHILYSIINLYWQLQLTQWNVKHEKWSSLKHMCQVLRNVILVFMLASYRLWYDVIQIE